jgi:hypothetical protein
MKTGHVIITSFWKLSRPELRVLFIGEIFIELSSKWPPGSKLEMADVHERQRGDLKGLFFPFLVRKPN